MEGARLVALGSCLGDLFDRLRLATGRRLLGVRDIARGVDCRDQIADAHERRIEADGRRFRREIDVGVLDAVDLLEEPRDAVHA